MRGIKIPQYEFALKMQGLMREGGAYLWDTTVYTRSFQRVKLKYLSTPVTTKLNLKYLSQPVKPEINVTSKLSLKHLSPES